MKISDTIYYLIICNVCNPKISHQIEVVIFITYFDLTDILIYLKK